MKQIRAMMIGAMCNGDGGHHILTAEEIAKRRRKESLAVAQFAGIEYDVWEDSSDCVLYADLDTRARLVREIRKFNPDIIFCSRPNDYHADHRNASMLVQDASYLLVVPHYCPDVPAMKETPPILYFYDHFQNPPFKADIAVDIDDVIDDKFKMLSLHESQVYEWLPYTKGLLDQVPAEPEKRLEWLHEPRIPRDGTPIDAEILARNLIGLQSEYREAKPAVAHRDTLMQRYGDKGSKTLFAEVFGLCEYGGAYSDELIPF